MATMQQAVVQHVDKLNGGCSRFSKKRRMTVGYPLIKLPLIGAEICSMVALGKWKGE